MGTVQYCRVAPRIPSIAVRPDQQEKYWFEPYVQVWGMLGTAREDGPKMTPREIQLDGRRYPVANVKTSNRNHEFYYLFDVKDPDAVKRLPVDPMAGNLIAAEPEQRHRSPVSIVFTKHDDGSTWVGVGEIEQSAILTRDAVVREIEGP